MWHSLIIGMIFSVRSADVALAPVEVSHSVSPPSSQVLASYNPSASTGFMWRNNESGRRDLGQSFQIAEDAAMGSFSLSVEGNIQAGAAGKPFAVKIFESVEDSSIGSIISEQAGTFPGSAINPINPGWLTFDINDLNLTAGKIYTFMLSWNNLAVQDQDQVLAIDGAGAYAGGRQWQSDDGSTYSSNPAYDLLFSVQAPGVSGYDPIKILKDLSPGVPADVTLMPGTYNLPSGGITLSGLTDVQIRAAGVTFLGTDPTRRAMSFVNCRNVTISGLTIDYNPLPFTQGTITAINASAKTADFEIHAGYSDLIDLFLVTRFHLFEAAQHRWKPGAPDYYIQPVERLTSRVGRLHLGSSAGFGSLAVGDRVVLNLRTDIVLSIGVGCGDITFKDVTIHSGPGAAIMGRMAEDAGTFENVRVVPGPRPPGAVEDRLLSTGADAFNFAYTRAGPMLDGCEFSYMGDDSVNLHGVTLPVLEWEDARTCLSVRPTSEKFDELLRSGDEVRFITKPDFRLLDSANIETISSASESYSQWEARIKSIWPSFKNSTSASFYRVRFDRDLYPGTTGLDGSDIFFEVFASSASGYVIKNCYFHDHRARGLRLMAANGLVEGNTLERIKGVAMSIGPSFDYWMEAGWVENVIVSNNVIRDVGQGANLLWSDSSTLGAISIFAEVEPHWSSTTYYPGNSNLTIVGNTINGCSLDGIHVVAGNNVWVEGNTITNVNQVSAPSAGAKRGLTSGQPITVQYSDNVVVTNNIVE